jgi:tRNA nucleotidyltransferase (CCA-adding enzyme)
VIAQTPFRTVDIAHYRKDLGGSNHRHPQEVDLDCSIDEDILRRDFTVNAIAVNRSGAVMPITAVEDIDNKVLRLVGTPFARFEDDALRIMRAYRFAATKGLTIHPETRNAIKVKRELLKYISPERIREEFFKILVSPGSLCVLRQMRDDHIFDIILPEFVPCIDSKQHSKYHEYTVAEHIFQVVAGIDGIEPEPTIAAFFHDIGKPLAYFVGDDDQPHHYGKKEYDQLNHEIESKMIAQRVLKQWGCSSQFIEDVCTLVEYHMAPFWDQPSKKRIKKLLNIMGVQRFKWLINLRFADRDGSGTRSYHEQVTQEFIVKHAEERIKHGKV